MRSTAISFSGLIAGASGSFWVPLVVVTDGKRAEIRKLGSKRRMPGFDPRATLITSRSHVFGAAATADYSGAIRSVPAEIVAEYGTDWKSARADTLQALLPTGKMGVSMGIKKDQALWALIEKAYPVQN